MKASDMIGNYLLKENKIRTASNFFTSNNKIIGLPFNLGDLINRNLSIMIPEKYGIYHLFSDDVLVYIGMSKNLKKRLIDHYRKKDMEFDNVLWFVGEGTEYNLKQIFQIEKNMIKYWKPFYNEAYLNSNLNT